MHEPTRKTPPTSRRWLTDLIRLAAVVVVVLTARTTLADHYFVPSGSMEPTVAVGDRLVVNKLAYDVHLPLSSISLWRRADPARGDVAIFPSPQTGETLVKRVIAVPGDEVAIRGGAVILNREEVVVARRGDALIEQLG